MAQLYKWFLIRTIETNPISNYLTNAIKKLEDHPLKFFINKNVNVTISADDPELLNTNLNNEYLTATQKMGLTINDLIYTNKCALKASFIAEEQKKDFTKLWDA